MVPRSLEVCDSRSLHYLSPKFVTIVATLARRRRDNLKKNCITGVSKKSLVSPRLKQTAPQNEVGYKVKAWETAKPVCHPLSTV